jgi:diacylglycerol kinase
LRYAIKNERNFQIELLVASIVIFLLITFDMMAWERVLILFMITWVLAAELVNTVVERISDILKPRIHPYARLIKDLMAAAVLVSAIASLIIGGVLFAPYVMELFS